MKVNDHKIMVVVIELEYNIIIMMYIWRKIQKWIKLYGIYYYKNKSRDLG